LISEIQRFYPQTNGGIPSKEQIRQELEGNGWLSITQEPDYAAKEALQEIKNRPLEENIEGVKRFLYLTDRDAQMLRGQLQAARAFTAENYPDLAYPIYVYYLSFYMLCARQHNTKHLDQSYVRDFRYLHYLNFCDRFITNEKSTPYIINSLPYADIRNIPVSNVEKLKMELKQE